jgi:DNA-binding SARP family transcriptional activator
VDLDAFTAAVRRGLGEPITEEAVSGLEQVLTRYSRDLLEDAPYAGWASLDRDAVRARWIEGCLTVARGHEHSGRLGRALEWYQRALARDATLEDAHRGAMRCYAGLGHRDLALRQYARCLQVLRQELETAPDAETVALRDAIARGETPQRVPMGRDGG